MEQIKQLKEEIAAPPNIIMEEQAQLSWIKQIKISEREIFEKVCGDVTVEDSGLVAIQCGTNAHAQIRGRNLYSTGIHNIRFKLDKSSSDWLFFGIISSSTPMKARSYASPSAYGWVVGCGQVWLNGVQSDGYGGWDGDICENDTVELTLNCNENKIQCLNERTKQKYELKVDLTSCPYPWKLHLNLHFASDRVSICF
ncbi:unnamed protein product [Didymodactylos carnosus]|uniref:Uncharacterized protein n=1 Tax=Didymodactylos carnosus TaxID=1234261 RepID=A0A815ERE0_9BILA|nr:unnamed protein product [Didymodactylos carnosus]CAF1584930.1 unnamed protein product [Didymodactylos carnosus]CAF4161848.1 unnamed protein product [Didymodactylos carnosus]CAF4385866.1 unnamed protein product [Didymodactylos carnosus]